MKFYPSVTTVRKKMKSNDPMDLEDAARNTHNVIEKLLDEEKCKVILDIPCGRGAFSKRLLDKRLHVFSSDIQNIVQFNQDNFKIADMNQRLPYNDEKFDGVVCIDGVEHIERQFDFIRECGRIIKKNGILIISTPNVTSLRSRWRWLLTGFHNKCKVPLNEEEPSFSHHINMISFPGIRYLLEINGFTIKSIATNRIKAISWIYVTLAPIVYIVTLLVFNKEEKNRRQRKRNKQIIKQLFSLPVLFGETLIVKAVKREL